MKDISKEAYIMAISTPHLFPVHLTPDQREELEAVCSAGSAKARKIRRARVLLLCDRDRPGGKLPRRVVAQMTGVHVNSVNRICKRFCQEGPQTAIVRRPRENPPVPIKLDGKKEAQLVAICCGPAPQGRAHWTLKLLVDELVKQKIVVSIAPETVRRTLKKMNFSLGGKSAGASPKKTRPDSSRRWKTSSTSTRRSTRRKSR
jgi:transposase